MIIVKTAPLDSRNLPLVSRIHEISGKHARTRVEYELLSPQGPTAMWRGARAVSYLLGKVSG